MKNICKNNSIFYILQILKRKYLSDANIALNVLQFYSQGHFKFPDRIRLS